MSHVTLKNTRIGYVKRPYVPKKPSPQKIFKIKHKIKKVKK